MAASERKVAVVGAGIGGLGAAYTLGRSHSVRLTVYEARPVLGGHANTVDVAGADGATYPLDTGFLVYNENTYPNLCGLFEVRALRARRRARTKAAGFSAAAPHHHHTTNPPPPCAAPPPAGARRRHRALGHVFLRVAGRAQL